MKLSELTGRNGDFGRVEITGLALDSRAVKPGYLFAALKGTAADGRDFIPDALSRGAAAILLDRWPGGDRPDAPLIEVEEPRRVLARYAARFYGAQPAHLTAVTGTNGKTSTVTFLAQLYEGAGHKAAAIGTLGVKAADWSEAGALTSPDPIRFQEILSRCADRGITYAAFEASSHGLDQHRVDGAQVTSAVLTGLSRDHLDYHGDMEQYWAAKRRLFEELLPAGGTAIAPAGLAQFAELANIAKARGFRLLGVGRKEGAQLRIRSLAPESDGLVLTYDWDSQSYEVRIPLFGAFQGTNALLAAAAALAEGVDPDAVAKGLAALSPVPGRMEDVTEEQSDIRVLVDYAHTPDGLETVLKAVRPHVQGRLSLVFGCGGDRDAGKRPEMGRIAAELADRIYVTDDNPRSENPAVIRTAILDAAPDAVEIADRAAAIRRAVRDMSSGDILLICGKGHEEGQIVGKDILPFSDKAVAQETLQKRGGRHE